MASPLHSIALADAEGRYNKTRSNETLTETLERAVAGAPSCGGRPVAGAIKGLYILRAAADTSVEFNSRALRLPDCQRLERITFRGFGSRFREPRLTSLSLPTWPLFDTRPFRKVARETG